MLILGKDIVGPCHSDLSCSPDYSSSYLPLLKNIQMGFPLSLLLQQPLQPSKQWLKNPWIPQFCRQYLQLKRA